VFAGARRSSGELDERATTGNVHPIEVDLADPAGPAALAAAAGQTVDVLVNNVGSAPARPGGVLSITDDQWLATSQLARSPSNASSQKVLPTP
jgi:NAD(P)-dependent dehydrogenase (short-subunit alcohol dehydrogenase family)